MARFLVINGPNLNALGRRDSAVYGFTTLPEIQVEMSRKAEDLGVQLEFFQSNSEGAIIDFIQGKWDQAQGIIINPGALTHYSYSLREALVDSQMPVVEVHISDIHVREEWRRHSVIAEVARKQIAGQGWKGYLAALESLAILVKEERT